MASALNEFMLTVEPVLVLVLVHVLEFLNVLVDFLAFLFLRGPHFLVALNSHLLIGDCFLNPVFNLVPDFSPRELLPPPLFDLPYQSLQVDAGHLLGLNESIPWDGPRGRLFLSILSVLSVVKLEVALSCLGLLLVGLSIGPAVHL